MIFNDVIGQKDAEQQLIQLEEEHHIPHAMLFCGPEGCGKLAIALDFASYLLKKGLSDIALKTSEAMLKKLEHPDLHFTYPTIKTPGMGSEHQPVSDDFSNEWHELMMSTHYPTFEQWQTKMGGGNKQAVITGAESDAIARKLCLKSSQGGYKISIIWLPERQNIASANKLLKLLEEPPQMTIFMLISEQPELLLETIRSRTQRFDFKKIEDKDIEDALVSARGLEPDMAHRVARVANGNWNKALEELDAGNENKLFLDMFIMLMRLAYMRNIHDQKKWSETVAAFSREKQRRMILYFQRMVRENFMFNFRNKDLIYMTQDEENFAKNFARFINEANVIDISELLNKAYRDIGQNANAKIVFFDLALNMIVLLIRK
nr:DNA polymerase III subunit delta [Prevotella sp.]